MHKEESQEKCVQKKAIKKTEKKPVTKPVMKKPIKKPVRKPIKKAVRKPVRKRSFIPQAVREQTWNKWNGQVHFKHKCYVTWCKNIITPFTFQAGHVVSQAKGGGTDVSNLRPICPSCNLSMGTMNMREFSRKYNPKKKIKK
jgi:5-methylcytosine-specific restriction endonuclease McrA